MKKRKKSRKQISEEAGIRAENSPIVRQLRELYAKNMAELEQQKLDADAR